MQVHPVASAPEAVTDTTPPRQSGDGRGGDRAGHSGVDVETMQSLTQHRHARAAATATTSTRQSRGGGGWGRAGGVNVEEPAVTSADVPLPDDDTALETDTARDAAGLPRKKKNRRLSGKPSRGRKAKY